jgi:hypothetical protein
MFSVNFTLLMSFIAVVMLLSSLILLYKSYKKMYKRYTVEINEYSNKNQRLEKVLLNNGCTKEIIQEIYQQRRF